MLEFAKNLADFAVASGKKHIIVLSSLDFGRWQTVDMSRFISPDNYSLSLSCANLLMYCCFIFSLFTDS